MSARMRVVGGLTAAILAAAGWWYSRPTPPEIVHHEVNLALAGNDRPAAIYVEIETDRVCEIDVELVYESTYLYAGDSPLWRYVTEGSGVYRASAKSDRLAHVFAIPRAYHSDLVTVRVDLDSAGGVSHIIHDAPIVMPLDPAPEHDPATYAVAAFQSGGTLPNTGTVEEWAQSEVIVTDAGHIFAAHEGTDYQRWIERVRAQPGSRNVAVFGFSDIALWDNSDLPVAARRYSYCERVQAERGVQMFMQDVTGADLVPRRAANGHRVGSRLLNFTNPEARAEFIRLIRSDWDHAANRVAGVGLLWDVWEVDRDHHMVDPTDPDTWTAAHNLIDVDRDGVPMIDDPDDRRLYREARIAFLREMRAAIPELMVAINSVSARSDPEMLAQLDGILVESLQIPRDCSTGYGSDPWYHATDPQLRKALPNVVDAMRSPAYVLLEGQGSCRGVPMDAGYLEALSLLYDHVYPIYTRHDQDWSRVWWHPSERGLADLHALGRATGPATRKVMRGGAVHLARRYEHGGVDVIIPDPETTDWALFDFAVKSDGETLRTAP